MIDPARRTYWPTQDWRLASPQEKGLQPELLAKMQVHITDDIPGLHGLLIVRDGYLVFEEYYQGFHRKSYNSVSSVTKSYISALVGIALAQGKLQSLDQKILNFFPAYAARVTDSRKQAITLRHMLSLQTGFAHEMPDKFWLNPSPVQLTLERPMIEQPGEVFYYDSNGVDILSAILTRVTGMSAAAYADATLFKTIGVWHDGAPRFTWRNDPQGVHLWHGDAYWDEKHGYLWKVDPEGNSAGGFGAHFTAREMAKFGYLYLNRGFWDGEQLIPADYVAESTRQHSNGGAPVGDAYGYLWWLTQYKGHNVFFASGYGGKTICVIPSLDLVVVTISSTDQEGKNAEQWPRIKALVPDYIIPALA
ncbi:MAG TPA: serine hydrolase [Ktedonobacteraceae bacterium]|nr:serine hydrolase [Ktedonobacteraceae bacterium]